MWHYDSWWPTYSCDPRSLTCVPYGGGCPQKYVKKNHSKFWRHDGISALVSKWRPNFKIYENSVLWEWISFQTMKTGNKLDEGRHTNALRKTHHLRPSYYWLLQLRLRGGPRTTHATSCRCLQPAAHIYYFGLGQFVNATVTCNNSNGLKSKILHRIEMSSIGNISTRE
jgi:hypothetical protein